MTLTTKHLEPNNTAFPPAKHSLPFQLVAGVAAAGLNIALSVLMLRLRIPLFMDTLFTAAASFWGAACGITAAVAHHAIYFFARGLAFPKDLPNTVFVLCSLTVTAGVRILVRAGKRRGFHISPLHLIALGIALALIISVEGGVFYALLVTYSEYNIDNRAVSTLIYTLVTQGIPLAASAALARIPVNLIDKTVSVLGGWGVALLTEKTVRRIKQKFSRKREGLDDTSVLR